MPQTPHIEHHFTASDTIRDIIIGMSDGLTVPFALAAGLSGAAASTAVVVTAGLAEIAAGSISMGLGGYLAARNDADHYESERRREQQEVVEMPQAEKREVKEIFLGYGLTDEASAQITEAIAKKPEAWVDFMMRFELALEKPEPSRALRSALTIAVSYAVGGFIPLTPYIIFSSIPTAQIVSVIATLIALVIFGYIKGRFTGTNPVRSALQTMLVGGLAAATAFAIAKLIS
ncbi:MAG: VIT1/CCC1 transporter family protein [Anaerolineae bacterium]|nr:VIT1/CCC1 transporter family protein [Anaerolineae bacterium]